MAGGPALSKTPPGGGSGADGGDGAGGGGGGNGPGGGNGGPGSGGGFVRRIGLFQATAINMSQMCGIGPFVTIPLMVAAFGGPQAVIGFLAGAVLALADGLIWA
ncbi:amino acid permease, partial [Streptomyces sp. MCAF7]